VTSFECFHYVLSVFVSVLDTVSLTSANVPLDIQQSNKQLYVSFWTVADTLDLCNVADGWQAFGNQCYKYNTDRRTWQEAVKQCAMHDNAQLVTLNSADKFNILEHVVSCKDFEAAVWIGLSDTVSKRECNWSLFHN